MVPSAHLYGLAWCVAGLLWVLCGTRALVRHAQPCGGCAWPRAGALLVACIVAALAGARLHHAALASATLDDLLREAVAPPGSEGAGLRITGGLLTALAVLLLVGPRATPGRLPRVVLLDAVVPLAGLAIALGRLGCFADGCCFGVPCSAPWCPRFPFASPAYWSHVGQALIPDDGGASLPVHPLQLYLGAAGIVAMVASRTLVRPSAPGGTATLVFVATLAATRALLEPLREASFGGGVAYEIPLSGGIGGAALAVLVLRVRTAQRADALRSEAS